MPLFRLLILSLIVGAGFYLYRRIKLSRSISRKTRPPSTQVVKCKTCGLHTPKSEAIEHHGNTYCCREHLENDIQN